MARPLIRSFIDGLLKENRGYDFVCQIYETMINKWTEREAIKFDILKKFNSPEEFKKEHQLFHKDLVVYLYRNPQKNAIKFHHYPHPGCRLL